LQIILAVTFMTEFLSQFMVTARGDNGKDWMNLLVLIIMVIAYVVVGIIKKVKEEKIPFGDKTAPGQKPASQQPKRHMPAQRQSRRPQVPEGVKRLSLAAQRIQERLISGPVPGQPARAAGKDFIKTQAKPALIETDIEPEQVTFVLEESDFAASVSESSFEKEAVAFESLIKFGEPADLTRAVLYYEIFGRPISLRQGQGTLWD